MHRGLLHRALWRTAAFGALFLACSEPTDPAALSEWGPLPAPNRAIGDGPVARMIGAGNIASCESERDSVTAEQLSTYLARWPEATVFTLGNNTDGYGRASEFSNCYEPTWGRFKTLTRPSVGNREYWTGTAAPTFDYFGAQIGARDLGYYSYDLGAWHVIVLNSNTYQVPARLGSEQQRWLADDLAANTRRCILAYWHHPRFASSDEESIEISNRMAQVWADLYAAGATLIVNGHDPHYERSAPQDVDGNPRSRGIRQFIAGTGGARARAQPTAIAHNSEVQRGETFGLLELQLGDGWYSWNYLATPGDPFTDSGSAPCAPNAEPDTLPVFPGESIQAKVDANPAGTVFLIKAGRHVRQSIVPKDGNAFIGEQGAILDGEGSAIRAFSGTARDVLIEGLVIERYAPGSQKAAIHGGASVGWLIQGNELRYNDGSGLHTGRQMRVLRNHFHHNAQTGLGGGGDSVIVEGNEIAFNNHEKAYDYGWEAGGAKFVRTRWLTLRDNHVHENWGHGLWIDIDCWTTLIENNRSDDNAATGIFVEISHGAIVRNNTLRGNGFNETWLNGAGIEINSSTAVEVYGNTITGNRNGIVALEGSRGTGAYGPRIVRDLHVHDNVVDVAATGASGIGIYGSGTLADVFADARNNRFVNNTYVLGANAKPFTWNDRRIDETAWLVLGMDVTGIFQR